MELENFKKAKGIRNKIEDLDSCLNDFKERNASADSEKVAKVIKNKVNLLIYILIPPIIFLLYINIIIKNFKKIKRKELIFNKLI